jgi:Domain of Unknown Function (DUF1080)
MMRLAFEFIPAAKTRTAEAAGSLRLGLGRFRTLSILAGVAVLLSLPALGSDVESVCKGNPHKWRQLFNGKDLQGWKHVGAGSMTVGDDGLLSTHGGMGLLYWTGGKIGNCIIHVVFRMGHENDNSGVFIRIPIEPTEAWMPVHYGYEVQIENHPERFDPPEGEFHLTGTLYSLTKALARTGKPGPEWNTLDITLDGSRTVVKLNGAKVTDYREGDPVPARKFDYEPVRGPRPKSGFIGLQNDNDLVFFKEIAIKPLR